MLEERAFAVFLMLIAVAIGSAVYYVGGVLVICLVFAVVIAVVLWTPLRGWLGIPPPKRERLSSSGMSGPSNRRGRPTFLKLSGKIKGLTVEDNKTFGDIDFTNVDENADITDARFGGNEMHDLPPASPELLPSDDDEPDEDVDQLEAER